jgi:hypothetical protein
MAFDPIHYCHSLPDRVRSPANVGVLLYKHPNPRQGQRDGRIKKQPCSVTGQMKFL